MRQRVIEPRNVDAIPQSLEDGVLYVCERYGIATHKCCCGCGEEVITPLNSAEWSIVRQGARVSLFPSIGNWSFPCRSHYWIKGNRVVWAGTLTPGEIRAVKVQDREARIAYAEALSNAQEAVTRPGLVGRIWRAVRHWFGI